MSTRSHHPTLFVGLGNPGEEYAKTRHNLGFLVIDAFADKCGWSFKQSRVFHGAFCKGEYQGRAIHLLKPTTYMNESGRSVGSYADYYGITPHEIVVITDDMALEFGTMRLRESGSSGGHNGLKSLIDYLGTDQFARLRMGIGKPPEGWDQADYVLSKFTLAEGTQLGAFVQKGVDVIASLTEESMALVMSQVNTNKTMKT